MATSNESKKTSQAKPEKPQNTEKEPEQVPVFVAVEQKANSGWSIGRIFWGLLLVTTGILLLLDNFNLLHIEWTNLWRLWPLAVIASGLSILAVKHWLWRILTIVFMILTLGAVVMVATGNFKDTAKTETQQTNFAELSKEVKRAEVNISAGASRVRIDTSDLDKVATVILESNVLRLVESTSVSDETQRINLSAESSNNWWVGGYKNDWDITLTRKLPLSVNLYIGASDTEADFSHAKLGSLTVKAGASNLKLTLGDQLDFTSLNLDSGASSVLLRLPEDSGVRLKIDGGLSSKNFSDLTKINEGEYRSEGYDSATKKIDITANVGLASFTIERY